MVHKEISSLFKSGSRTYFYSSLFFPKDVKEDIFILYGFVRKADNFVDSIPQQKNNFESFKKAYESALSGNKSNDIAIGSFMELMEKRGFNKEWVDAFLHAMELDLTKKIYMTLKETKEYMYGSAEVIGLMMSKILGLPERSFNSAKYLGRAMQYINFIRDIVEDIKFGRTYLPKDEMDSFGIKSLELVHTKQNRENFTSFIHSQLLKYEEWQKKAEEGYRYIPRRYLIPIKTASDMYMWTAQQIKKDPFVVYRKKVKPSKARIIFTACKNMFCREVK